MSLWSSFETITKQGLHSVVEKPLHKRIAFTLAEVLIVFGIIGLIADMTIPTLISSTQEKAAVTRLKKLYATFDSAFRLAVVENGTPDMWDLKGRANGDGAVNLLNIILPYLNTIKVCGKDKGCFIDTSYRQIDGSYTGAYNYNERTETAKAVLANGAAISIYIHDNGCVRQLGTGKYFEHVCASIDVDMDGMKGSNQIGKDFFTFYLTLNGVVPNGLQDSESITACLGRTSGFGCTAWVIYNGNMDYFHCNDLSWDGKKSCR